jgi:hypothetical protein
MCRNLSVEVSNDLESLPLSPVISSCSSCTGKGKSCPFRREHEKSEPRHSSGETLGSSVWQEKTPLAM